MLSQMDVHDLKNRLFLLILHDCLKLRWSFFLKIETKCDIRINCVVIHLLPEILKYILDFET